MAVTEDHVVGRLTVELDDDGAHFLVTVVTVVTIETANGADTLDLSVRS